MRSGRFHTAETFDDVGFFVPVARLGVKSNGYNRRMELFGDGDQSCSLFAVLVDSNEKPYACVVCELPRAAHRLTGLRVMTAAEAHAERLGLIEASNRYGVTARA